MSALGQRWTIPYIALATATRRALPRRWQGTFAPLLAVSLPLAAATAVVPQVLVPLIAVLWLPLPYYIAAPDDDLLFEIDRQRAHFGFVLPFTAMLAAWGWLLAGLSRLDLFLNTVMFFSIALLLLIAPALRWCESQNRRRVPLSTSYLVSAVVIAATQLLYSWRLAYA